MDDKEDKPLEAPSKVAQDWELTQSLMDPNSLSFTSFASEPPTYYTSTPSANILSSQPHTGADLHTPNMPLNLLTPLTVPQPNGTAQGTVTQSAVELGSFRPPMGSQHNNNVDQFGQPHTFAPSALLRRDPDINTMDENTFGGLNISDSLLGWGPGHDLATRGDGMDGHNNDK